MKLGYLSTIFLLLMAALQADEAPINFQECLEGVENVSTRLHPCSRDFEPFADLIVWTARESGTPDCWAEVFSVEKNTTSNEFRVINFNWDAGFRVGAGYGMDHDQWDTRAYYTRFHTRGKDEVTAGPGSVHSSFLGGFYVDNFNGKGITGPAYEQASIDWKIRFNMFDWDLGRSFWVSEELALRPFLGLKGGWIHQLIRSKWQNPDLASFPGSTFYSVATENLKNNFWGIGPQVGLNTKWNLLSSCSQYFNLFGDFSTAVMFGHWIFGDIFNNDIGQQVKVIFNHLNSGATMVRAFMGFGWEGSYCGLRFSTKLGYETQFWLDQLQFYSFTGGRWSNLLTLQGGTLEFSVDF